MRSSSSSIPNKFIREEKHLIPSTACSVPSGTFSQQQRSQPCQALNEFEHAFSVLLTDGTISTKSIWNETSYKRINSAKRETVACGVVWRRYLVALLFDSALRENMFMMENSRCSSVIEALLPRRRLLVLDRAPCLILPSDLLYMWSSTLGIIASSAWTSHSAGSGCLPHVWYLLPMPGCGSQAWKWTKHSSTSAANSWSCAAGDESPAINI